MRKNGYGFSKYLMIIIILAASVGFTIWQNREYLIKAAYIEKFTRFIEWPANALADDFVITILGKDSFNGALEDIAKKYKIKNLPLKIKYITDIEDIERCDLLFISKIKKNRLNEILTHINNKPMLTVSETDNYGERGVHINFYYTDKGTIHFEINHSRLKKSGFEVDMYLLELGKIIGE